MITKILVPTDGSECALEAAAYAAALARELGAKASLLHVVEIPRLPLSLGDLSADQRERSRRALMEAGLAILALTKKPFARAGIPVESELREGRASEVITAVAAQGGYDLIVIGSHGAGATTRLLLGSVSEAVARTAPCPVLIIRRGTAKVSAEAEQNLATDR